MRCSTGLASLVAIVILTSCTSDGGTPHAPSGTGGTPETGGTPPGSTGTGGGNGGGGAVGGEGEIAAGGSGGNASLGVVDASGTSSTGGSLNTGGSLATGGTANIGGTLNTGGAPRYGGRDGAADVAIPGSGGSLAAGGVATSGGRSGGDGGMDASLSSTGGRPSAGGVTTSGGRPGSGGLDGGAGSGGSGGMGGTLPAASGGQVTGYGFVQFSANSKNQFVRLQTTLLVPIKPAVNGTLFLWPGLQPGGANYSPIDNGVLQPVLTWGRSCAPGTQPSAYSSWWISGQYVNTYGKDPGYVGCYGGPVMSVNVGDALNIDMQLAGTVWTQTITDVQTGSVVSFSKDMLNQAQNYAYFDIEQASTAPSSPVVFANTTFTYGSADVADCRLVKRGQTDFVSAPQSSSNGLQCFVQQIILKAQGIK